MDSYTYGYARVSTRQQELNRQLDLLKQYSVSEIVEMTGIRRATIYRDLKQEQPNI